MIRKILTFLSLIALCNCHQHNTVDSDIILIDANKKYPALDLKLSDIAEISYIPSCLQELKAITKNLKIDDNPV